MIRLRTLIRRILEPKRYLWMGVILVKETPRALLIIFDGREAWIPKSWLHRVKRNKSLCAIEARLLAIDSLEVGQTISIQLSEYHWVMKFS